MAEVKSYPRYVVLRHEGIPEPHFDLMLESDPGSALVTFRSPIWPLEDNTVLTALGEHRREYLTYEGPISGDRGHVHRIAAGTFQWIMRGGAVSAVRFLDPQPQVWKFAAGADGQTIATRT